MRQVSLIIFLIGLAFAADAQKKITSPLGVYSPKWDDVKYLACNTAKNASYMSDSEKKIIYILNLARMNPRLFKETVVKSLYPRAGAESESTLSYWASLNDMLATLKPLPILKPDSLCYRSAFMHASTSGKLGYTGHERQTREAKAAKHYYGECCSYGYATPITIVMQLLVDDNVPSLSHRNICLGSYKSLGVSLHKHKEWRYNCVLDFFY